MDDTLVATPVRAGAHLHKMARQGYGAAPWQQEINAWQAFEADAEVRGGTTIWAYWNRDRAYVGFGSLRLYE